VVSAIFRVLPGKPRQNRNTWRSWLLISCPRFESGICYIKFQSVTAAWTYLVDALPIHIPIGGFRVSVGLSAITHQGINLWPCSFSSSLKSIMGCAVSSVIISAKVIEAHVSTYSLDGFCVSKNHVIQHSIALGLS